MTAMPNYRLAIAALLLAVGVKANSATTIQIQNESGRACELYWIDTSNGDAHPMKADPPLGGGGEMMQLNSYAGHVFECREAPNADTGTCDNSDQQCSIARITVPDDFSEGVASIIDEFYGVEYRSMPSADEPAGPPRDDAAPVEFLEVASPPGPVELPFKPVPRIKCMDILDESSIGSGVDTGTAQSILTDLVQCMQSNVTHELLASKDVLTFEKLARTNQVGFFENYTCADSNMPTSTAIRAEKWLNPKEDRSFDVSVLHERPSSKVHTIANFISEEECQAMADSAAPLLHKATVADGKGGSTLSPNRKAMQAGIKVPWAEESEGNPIARLSRRVYDYTNHVLGLDIKENGQEDLMSIQYFGRGESDTEPDRYMPHCDGDCDGRVHKFGTRMATMVLYCTIPDKGGATNFRNAGLHIKPKVGSGTFFAYLDPEKNVMDTGFTEHSGCAVVDGEKKIVTQWIRFGVDDANPWDSFNTLGLQKTDEDEQM